MLTSISSMKQTKTRHIVVNTNSFILFLGEFTAWQFAFEINWPLALTKNEVTKICNELGNSVCFVNVPVIPYTQRNNCQHSFTSTIHYDHSKALKILFCSPYLVCNVHTFLLKSWKHMCNCTYVLHIDLKYHLLHQHVHQNNYLFLTITYIHWLLTKGQVISKGFFGVFNFFQKTDENTFHSFVFGRIHGLTVCFKN